MDILFDITKFDSYKEDNRREVKRANGGLPNSLWDTYSAFANCYGGILLLGVKENSDKSWNTTGLKKKDKDKLLKDFWDTVNNPKKVSINLLSDDDVKIYDIGEDIVITIMYLWQSVNKNLYSLTMICLEVHSNEIMRVIITARVYR